MIYKETMDPDRVMRGLACAWWRYIFLKQFQGDSRLTLSSKSPI